METQDYQLTSEDVRKLETYIVEGQKAQQELDEMNKPDAVQPRISLSGIKQRLEKAIKMAYIAKRLYNDPGVQTALKKPSKKEKLDALLSTQAIKDILKKYQMTPKQWDDFKWKLEGKIGDAIGKVLATIIEEW
ncbi:hypothetical protein [Chryseobacterium potabilaquae]|uniref:Uncharacterized protein n=1 Tax=Chryseobacterium potabilaquae TaxID=2675057 RepID=A0A6N4X5S5_9FLAO|nr:hypothetical protein [Chryseobacterium potabilaquae]CAA7195446.1 hypothetical protein CHRY9293_01644 [Chryseobacterium potabilaquae]